MRVDYPRAGRSGVLRWFPSWRQVLVLFALGVTGVVAAFVLLYQQVPVPSPNDFSTAQRNVVMFADDKTEIGWQGDYNRSTVPFERIPQTMRYAVLAAEDREFYEHGAISPFGLGRALVNNVRGSSTQGGSTITQQYVKNYYLTQNRTLQRKVRELFIAMKIEKRLSKDEILGNYLNTIYFGRGSYGVQTASRAYFGKDVDKLDLAQSVALAAIIRSPGRYDPTLGESNQARFLARFAYVLDGMVEKGWLTQAQRQQVQPPEVLPKKRANRMSGPNGYLMDAAMRELAANGFSEDEIDRGGLRIVTTIDKKAQDSALKAVKEEVPTKDAQGLRAGLTAVRPGTGEIVAMYGGPDYVTESFNAATRAKKPGGSTFKPFALAAALENGIPLKTTYSGANRMKVPGYPKPVTNDDNESFGKIDLITATEHSVNTVFVQLGIDVGPEKVLDAATRAGIPSNAPGLAPYPSIVLGPASVSTLDLAGSYATLAARGKQTNSYLIKEVRDSDGAVLYRADPNPRQALERRAVDDVTYALEKVVTDGTGRRAKALGRPAAGKTGTAENNGDIVSTWFAGYTPQLSAAVLLYREDENGKPIDMRRVGGQTDAIGGRYPTLVWTAFMRGALAGQPVKNFAPPAWVGGTPTPTPTDTPTPTPTNTPTPAPSQPPTPSDTPTQTPQPPITLFPQPTGSTPPPPGGGGGRRPGGGKPTATATPTP